MKCNRNRKLRIPGPVGFPIVVRMIDSSKNRIGDPSHASLAGLGISTLTLASLESQKQPARDAQRRCVICSSRLRATSIGIFRWAVGLDSGGIPVERRAPRLSRTAEQLQFVAGQVREAFPWRPVSLKSLDDGTFGPTNIFNFASNYGNSDTTRPWASVTIHQSTEPRGS